MKPIADVAPSEPHVTNYDLSHLAVYARLLDASSEGAPWEKAARIVLGLDPLRDTRAKAAYDSHLARARWFTHTGYKLLLLQED